MASFGEAKVLSVEIQDSTLRAHALVEKFDEVEFGDEYCVDLPLDYDDEDVAYYVD